MLQTHKKEQINELVRGNLDDKCRLFSDQSTSYIGISDYVEMHVSVKTNKKITLKWVHIAISNAKRALLGIYHKISGKYLQNYLDEFCYKLNRSILVTMCFID